MFDQVAYNRDWRAANPDKVRAHNKRGSAKWRAAHPTANRDYHILKKYGLTRIQFEEKFLAQGSCCASCRAPDAGHKNGWQVDHNHQTGKTRGILCCACNIAVGFVEDPARVAILRTYLETYDATTPRVPELYCPKRERPYHQDAR